MPMVCPRQSQQRGFSKGFSVFSTSDFIHKSSLQLRIASDIAHSPSFFWLVVALWGALSMHEPALDYRFTLRSCADLQIPTPGILQSTFRSTQQQTMLYLDFFTFAAIALPTLSCSSLNADISSFVFHENVVPRALVQKMTCSTCQCRVRRFSSHFKSPRKRTHLFALQLPERDESLKSQKRVVKRAIFNLTKTLGTESLSHAKDEALPSKQTNQVFPDQAFNADALELPSGSLAITDRDLQEISEALLNSRPDLPREYFKTPTPDYQGKSSIRYLEEQLNKMKQYGKRSNDSSFRAVFENESGFFNQSEAFRMYLAPNNISEDPRTIINKAVTSRRGEDYRRRQNEALDKLQQAMTEVEKMSDSKSAGSSPTSSFTETCCVCGCRLSREEIIHAKQVEGKRICRECFVDNKEFKNGSPYLIGRVPDPTNARDGVNVDISQAKQWRERFTSSQNQPISSSFSSSFTTPTSSSRINSPLEPSKTIHESSWKLQGQQSSTERPSVPPSTILNRVKMLEQELEIYKSRAENAENEVIVLRGVIADLEAKLQTQQDRSFEDPDEEQPKSYLYENDDEYWVSMTDPDTGENFRWNKYTGETEW
jgi:hypothetical protein